MSKFKLADIKLKSDLKTNLNVKTVGAQEREPPKVHEFSFQDLKPSQTHSYLSSKSKYGALAATDPDRTDRGRKDMRFSLNSLMRESLSVEKEENRALEEKVKARAIEMAEKLKSEAIASGYAAGRKKGFEEAQQKFQQEGEERLKRLDQLMAELESCRSEIFKANERFLIELIFRIARMVILRELSTDHEYLLRLAKELVTRFGARDHVTIRIHPDDAKMMDTIREGILKSFEQLEGLSIETSTHVVSGGCQLETEWNMIDARIDQQLEEIYSSLLGKHSDGGNT